jgi:hypothetical protein
MSPPVDINENAPRAKESDFGEQKLKSFYSKLLSVVCKRFGSFESNRSLPGIRLLLFASNQNRLATLARHFGTSESCSARHFGTSQCVPSETYRYYSYLLRSSETSKRCLPAFLAVPRSSRGPNKLKKNNFFGTNNTIPSTLSLGAQVRWWLRPLPRGGTAQGPSLGERAERAGGR